MKVRLTKYNRIEKGKAGDIVEVSPDRALFLMRYKLAEPVTVGEQIETPETPKTAKAKTTAAKAAPKKTTRKRETT